MRACLLLCLAIANSAGAQAADRRVAITHEPAGLLVNGAGRDRTDYTDLAARRRALSVERPDGRWARAADRVAAGMAAGWDDLRRPGVSTAPLGEGGAGRVRFLAAWHRARSTAQSRAALRRAADQLVALGRGPDSINTSLYFGRAGVGLALLDAADALADTSLRQAARSEIARVIASVERPPDQRGAIANDVLMGDAGTAAALRAVWRRLDDTAARETAFALARSLAARGRPDSGDLYWPWRDNAPWNLPNFSHGTAGVATVLSMIAREPAAPPGLRDASLGGARYLRRVAVVDRRGMRIPNGWPVPERGWARPFDASWAHGQAGTARIFWELWLATRDTSHLGAVQALVAGLDSAGLVGTPTAGYGAEPFGFDYRFGLTGIADVLADLYDATGDRRYLTRALALAERVLATADPGAALTWTRPRPVFMPDPGTPATFTGLLHGAAGPGLLFLKLDALLRGRRPPEPLPDSPFGW